MLLSHGLLEKNATVLSYVDIKITPHGWPLHSGNRIFRLFRHLADVFRACINRDKNGSLLERILLKDRQVAAPPKAETEGFGGRLQRDCNPGALRLLSTVGWWESSAARGCFPCLFRSVDIETDQPAQQAEPNEDHPFLPGQNLFFVEFYQPADNNDHPDQE